MNLRTAHSMTLRPFALAAGDGALGDTTMIIRRKKPQQKFIFRAEIAITKQQIDLATI